MTSFVNWLPKLAVCFLYTKKTGSAIFFKIQFYSSEKASINMNEFLEAPPSNFFAFTAVLK